MKKLLLFDIDGTLLRTAGAGRVTTRDAMLEVFGTCSRVDTHHFGGKTDWQTLTELLEDFGYNRERIGEFMPRYEQAAARHLVRVFAEGSTAAPCAGAMETVTLLRERSDVLLGVVTGNCSSTAPLKLKAAGYNPAWFPVGAYGSEAYHRNDLPALALSRAIQMSGWHLTPQDVMVIGDTDMDIACARALGAVAVAVCTGFSTREELIAASPDVLLDDLTRLPDLL